MNVSESLLLPQKCYSFQCLSEDDLSLIAAFSQCTASCTCDLSNVKMATPAGVVSAILASHYRVSRGWITKIIVPKNKNVLNYLERVDFFAKLPESVALDRDISYLAQNSRNASDNFSEVMIPTEFGFDHVKDVVWMYLEQEIPDRVRYLYGAFEEVLENIQQHSDPNNLGSDRCAYSCVQVQIYAGAIQLAFGDLGVGFLSTLQQNPQHFDLADEAEALRGVLLQRFSRWSHQFSYRGGGLRRASEIVTKYFQGRLKVLSHCGVAIQENGEYSFGTTEHPFPGSLIWMRLPRIRS